MLSHKTPEVVFRDKRQELIENRGRVVHTKKPSRGNEIHNACDTHSMAHPRGFSVFRRILVGHYCLSQEKVDNTIKCAMILMRKLSNTKVELYAQKISGVDRWIGVKEKLYT